MNGSVTVQLGDTLVGTTATGKSEHYKSLNKTELATAQGQAFSKLLLAAQGKGSLTAAAVPEPEAKNVSAKSEASVPGETNTAKADALKAGASLAMLNPELKQLNQPVLSPQNATKSAKDPVKSSSEGSKEKSTTTRTDKSAANAVDASQSALGNQAMEAMLVPILPALPPLPPVKNESAVLTSEKGSAQSAMVTSKGAVVGAVGDKTTAADAAAKVGAQKAGAEVAPSAVEGQQTAWLPYPAGVAGVAEQESVSAVGASAASSSKDVGTKSLATTAANANGNSPNGASGTSGGAKDASIAASVTPDVVRDPSAGSHQTHANAKAAEATSSQSAATASVQASTNAAHTAAANVSTAVTVPHETPGGAMAPGQAAMQDAGALGAGGDGFGRSMSTASTGAAPTGATANAHALLDNPAPAGRGGTWQISSNRVEAGFANGQDSWTSVVAQRQQGHVTATLEMGSAAEHSTTVSMLPQLNQHLADRQLPVDQLEASVRQQPGSDQETGAPNQGQQPNQPQSQSQRGQVVTSAVSSVASVAATNDVVRSSVDGSRISVRA